MSHRPDRLRRSTTFGSPIAWMALALGLVFLAGLLLYAGYQWGKQTGQQAALAMQGDWRARLDAQQRALASRRVDEDMSLEEVGRRLGALQSDVARLEAIGRRLLYQSGAAREEIDAKLPLGQGGPEPVVAAPLSKADLMSAMQSLAGRVDSSEQQFERIDAWYLAMAARSERAQNFPAGYPVLNGWISSDFGLRTDPFTGQVTQHNGIDFAAPEGSQVLSAANGTVTWAGPYRGYGELVEVSHGGGYVTRYGHNSRILVQVGQRVAKGQPLARMGSTGRSTGPHVHFEVLQNNRYLSPLGFIQAAR